MIPSSVCPPWQPDLSGQSRRRARNCQRSYTIPWDTILIGITGQQLPGRRSATRRSSETVGLKRRRRRAAIASTEPCASLPAGPPGQCRAHRGNYRLFDTGRRDPARRGLSARGKWIRTISPALAKVSRLLPKGDSGPIGRIGSLAQARVVWRDDNGRQRGLSRGPSLSRRNRWFESTSLQRRVIQTRRSLALDALDPFFLCRPQGRPVKPQNGRQSSQPNAGSISSVTRLN
jgi:hypothetical protein